MANAKNVQLKKKIAGILTELYPQTLSTLVKHDDGKNTAEKVAELLVLINGKTDMTSVETRIQQIIGSAPAALDTLNELAAALGNDPNFSATITTALGNKVDKVAGKNLSTEDFTSALKTKLDGIAASANNYAHPTGDGNLHVPATGTSNNGKFLKAGSTAGSASWVAPAKADVGLGNVDNTSDANKPISTAVQTALNAKAGTAVATTSADGLMSKADKSKLDGVAASAEVNQNAFSIIKVGATTVEADTKTDTLEIVAGTNITITPDAANDKITIASANTTYSAATTAADGLMSKADKSKLDGVATGATVNNPSTTTPKANGTAAVGTEANFAKGDHVHPLQTTVSGSAGTAAKLTTARKINGVSFDGSADITVSRFIVGADPGDLTDNDILFEEIV